MEIADREVWGGNEVEFRVGEAKASGDIIRAETDGGGVRPLAQRDDGSGTGDDRAVEDHAVGGERDAAGARAAERAGVEVNGIERCGSGNEPGLHGDAAIDGLKAGERIQLRGAADFDGDGTGAGG